MGNDIKDILLVDYKKNTIKFELSYGYLDRIYEACNFNVSISDRT